ncbi:hypothetical protein F5Y07DRAFT_337219 [Xylaria sp. FL0933]|nr:hypothetical protein F5Y07DRAFT_337219 [Xylaria sp. FL0933]
MRPTRYSLMALLKVSLTHPRRSSVSRHQRTSPRRSYMILRQSVHLPFRLYTLCMTSLGNVAKMPPGERRLDRAEWQVLPVMAYLPSICWTSSGYVRRGMGLPSDPCMHVSRLCADQGRALFEHFTDIASSPLVPRDLVRILVPASSQLKL